MEQRIFSIQDINRYIRLKLESDDILGDVELRGEISNFTHHSSKHMYFTLKDASSRIRAIMFSSYNTQLLFVPKEGMQVVARGNISLYERDGQYQVYITKMRLDGMGSLYAAYEKLKHKLQLEGLFDPARKRLLPRFPKKIGIVTSPTGAAIKDILTTLRRRFPIASVLLYPVLVQGKGAVSSIVKAIETLNERGEVDVLIVGRGGGSLEELWAFNEEQVARAIAQSAVPVISAVGHETDFTIADFTADVRAATPTAAAELAVPHIRELNSQLQQYTTRLHKSLRQLALHYRQKWMALRRSAPFLNPRRVFLQQQMERLDILQIRLVQNIQNRMAWNKQHYQNAANMLYHLHPRDQIARARLDTYTLSHQLKQTIHIIFKQKVYALHHLVAQLDALSPLKVMARGYSLVYDEREQVLIKNLQQVQLGDIVKIKLIDGQLDCHIWGMKEESINE